MLHFERDDFVSVNIPGTQEPTVYQSVRYALEKYLFHLPNGSYSVELRFVEHWKNAADLRVFTVSLQSGRTPMVGLSGL